MHGKESEDRLTNLVYANSNVMSTPFFSIFSDESGLTLFLTPNLRSNNLGYLMTGQESLELEPGKDRVVAAGTLSLLIYTCIT